VPWRRALWFRYVLRELAGPFSLGLGLYTFLLLMNQFFLIAEKTLSKNLGWALTFQWLGYTLPQVLIMTLPMSVLLGTLIAVGRLSVDQEWIAVQSAGQGPAALAKPILFFGVLTTLVSLALYAWVVPEANYRIRQVTGQVALASNLASDMRPGVFYTQLQNTTIFVDNIRTTERQRLEGVMIHRRWPERGTEELTLARFGDIVPQEDGRLTFSLWDGVMHTYDPMQSDRTYQTSRYASYEVTTPAPRFLGALREDPSRSLSDFAPRDLLDERDRVRSELSTASTALKPHLVRRILMSNLEIHRRIALPFACLFFSLLAVPLGITRGRSGKGAGFAVSLLIILVYWLAFTLARDRAESGLLDPIAAVWLANVLIVIWAIVAYVRLRGKARGRRAWLARGWSAISGGMKRLLKRRSATDNGGDAVDPQAVEDQLYTLGGTAHRFLVRIDQYVARQYIRLTGLALASCYLIFYLIDLRRLLDGAKETGGSLTAEIGRYFVLASPGTLNFALPIACLVGAVVSFTLLSRTGELTAIRASGTSLRRTIAPVLLLTLAACGLLFALQDRIAPATNRRAAEVKDGILGRAPMTYGLTPGGQWAFGAGGATLYHFLLYDEDRDSFRGMRIFEIDRDRRDVSAHWYAETASWSPEDAWKMERGWSRTFDEASPGARFETFDETSNDGFDDPAAFARRQATLAGSEDGMNSQMSFSDARRMKRDLEANGYDTTRLEVSIWNKTAQPFTPLVMVLLGLPFAFKIGRKGSLYGIGVALLLVLAYWATFALFRAMGLETFLPPLLAAWAPNVLFGLLGTYLIFFIRT